MPFGQHLLDIIFVECFCSYKCVHVKLLALLINNCQGTHSTSLHRSSPITNDDTGYFDDTKALLISCMCMTSNVAINFFVMYWGEWPRVIEYSSICPLPTLESSSVQ